MNEAKINLVNVAGTFQKMMNKTCCEIKEIAEDLRMLIVDVLPGVIEVVWESRGLPAMVLTPKKCRNNFVTLLQ